MQPAIRSHGRRWPRRLVALPTAVTLPGPTAAARQLPPNCGGGSRAVHLPRFFTRLACRSAVQLLGRLANGERRRKSPARSVRVRYDELAAGAVP